MTGELTLYCLASLVYLSIGVPSGLSKQKEVAQWADKIIALFAHTIGWLPVMLVNAAERRYLQMSGRNPEVHLIEQRKIIDLQLCDNSMKSCDLEQVPVSQLKSMVGLTVGQQAQTERVRNAIKSAVNNRLAIAKNDVVEVDALLEVSKETLLESARSTPTSYKAYLLLEANEKKAESALLETESLNKERAA